MKIILTCCISLITGLTMAQKQSVIKTNETKEVTCKLTTPELQKRKATVITELKRLVLTRRELSDGFSYTFEGTNEILDKLTDFIKTERACCDFFTFQLTVDGNQAVLNITGLEGAKEFLKEEIGF